MAATLEPTAGSGHGEQPPPLVLVPAGNGGGPADGGGGDAGDAGSESCGTPAGGAPGACGDDRREPLLARCKRACHKPFWQKFFDSKPYHGSVILLVFIDLFAVCIDLGITLAHCPEPHLKPPVHTALEVLTYLSIGILCVFIVEFAAQLVCFGLPWLKVPAHVLDVTVVVASLVLELILRNSDLKDVVALLIVFRLWRIVRVLHATEEILHIEHGAKVAKLKKKATGARQEAAELRARVAQLEAQLAAAEGAAAAAVAPAGARGAGDG